MNTSTSILIETTINAPKEKVWDFWNKPEHIVEWCSGDDSWHTPAAKNDLRIWWRFSTTMAAKDGSASFDFEWTYTNVETYHTIDYTIDDGRKVSVRFVQEGKQTKVLESFEPEDINSLQLQKDGWQHILNNFKNYVEKQK